MEVLMKFDAMMKIRMAGVSASERKARTSLALNRAPRTFCFRSKASLTRFRKSMRTSSRKTIRFRMKSANTARLDARGTWGEWIQTLTPRLDGCVDQRAHWRLVGWSNGDWIQSDSAASPLNRASQDLSPLSETSA